jgi:hypothetical protein
MAERPIRVLAAGMVGSGSTFLYNVLREILSSGQSQPAVATYSDEWNPLLAIHPRLVLKSHWGIRALAPQAERGLLQPVMSVRHPGDCICSDMERFGYRFDYALQRVALSLAFCDRLRVLPETMFFRYEDGFAGSERTAPGLARILGLRLPSETLAEITRKYSAASVKAFAANLDRVPGLMTGRDNPADAWCPTTQIHRGHIGKLASGRWRDLPADQRRRIGETCGEDASSFGYDCAI